MDDRHTLLVEEGAAGDGFLARWPPQFPSSYPFTTFEGFRKLVPLSSCIFVTGDRPSRQTVNSLHEFVRVALNQAGYD